MLHTKVDQKGGNPAEVVKEEMRMRYDNPIWLPFRRRFLNACISSILYVDPIGSMDHLNAASEEDYVKFYKQFYVPNNAVAGHRRGYRTPTY